MSTPEPDESFENPNEDSSNEISNVIESNFHGSDLIASRVDPLYFHPSKLDLLLFSSFRYQSSLLNPAWRFLTSNIFCVDALAVNQKPPWDGTNLTSSILGNNALQTESAIKPLPTTESPLFDAATAADLSEHDAERNDPTLSDDRSSAYSITTEESPIPETSDDEMSDNETSE